MDDDVVCIKPHPGPQTAILSTAADIAFFGGQAGGGKTWALLAEGARSIDVPGYGAVIFRRTSPQITNEGCLWDESMGFYSRLGGYPRVGSLEWSFESGANISFRHLQHESDKLAWQGAQLCMIGFDEVTHFTETQFWYMLSRNRSTCGVRPYVRATCNPVHEDDEIGGWVHRLLQWWIDPETGLAVEERSGVLRWFVRRAGEIVWGSTRQELFDRFKDPSLPDDHEDQPQPKSLTFIPSKLSDNPTMRECNPEYRANLMALPEYERQQLLEGNWNARLQSGTFFKVGMIEIVDALPADLRFCRAWDLAATEGAGDWTAGGKIGKSIDGTFYICDMIRGQWETGYRDKVICQTAQTDGQCVVRLPEDPAAAGKSEAARMVRMLAGHHVKAVNVRGDKPTRASGLSSQVNIGNVKMLRGEWNRGLLQRMDSFPTKDIPDDEIDALADAFNELNVAKKLVFAISGNSNSDEKPHPLNALVERDTPAATPDAEGPPKPLKKRLVIGLS